MCAVVSGDPAILYSCLRVLGGLIENDPPIVRGCVSKSDPPDLYRCVSVFGGNSVQLSESVCWIKLNPEIILTRFHIMKVL